ncbi:glycerol-3-phosphate dehydrogenase/oxidase [Salicola sp. Rm-C-2C1-2]|uniref:glycerol-3-phosphate dehydrogenase/oxidase n=1 Tax=Salicola sp. Rm-C-2C1-2 TaxID=3141321 RepID=UPI0032E4A181
MTDSVAIREERVDEAALVAGDDPWDMVIIGGGITGAGILREAAREGYRVLLVEQRDFAWGTSSRSSKMVHGGLRYLASGDYRLTRDAVQERERMMNEAPGLVDNLYYIMPHFRRQFPGPGLFGMLLRLYDFLAQRRTRRFYPGESVLRWVPGLRRKGLRGGTRFSDAVTDDARLVLRILQESMAAGGRALNYARAESVTPPGDSREGHVMVHDELANRRYDVHARHIVHATGAWTDRLRGQLGAGQRIRPLRGSHLVFPFWKLPVSVSLSLIHPRDQRPMFVYPWEGVTVVGTTDLDHDEDLQKEAVLSRDEMDYLLEAVHDAFPDAHLASSDLISTWSGVRPVVSNSGERKTDPSDEKREHVIWNDQGVISVAGGKLTTFRLIALQVLDHVRTDNGIRRELDDRVFSPAPMRARPNALTAWQWRRLCGHYGSRVAEVLEAGPLIPVGHTDTLLAELVWSCRNEQVRHLDDLLLRRTRLGLLLPEGGEHWLATLREYCQPALGWDDNRWQQECTRYWNLWRDSYHLPPEPVA